ncbi:hypothetical protein QAD02_002096 [Eretmocerus hayati]|uniref:Uncharacterized protein n=1 Tax=Eretmocerus hayati TaxID=131215 RepID=A0ACC2NI99_9HYME|nr:hypothetical protein QAD02_002096 [Eretmocerus hayati]
MGLPTGNPIVFLDIAVDTEKVGRVIIELFKRNVPKTAENFRSLCTGEKGLGSKGKALHYKGSVFHKIIPHTMVQGGDIINLDGSSGESIYGSHFEDEDLLTPHNEKGLLSMVNEGRPNSNSSQFVITTASCPQLNGTNVVFGKVIRGLSVVEDLRQLSNANTNEPINKIWILNSGELSGCSNWGLEDDDGEDIYTPYPADWNYNPMLQDLSPEGIANVLTRIKDSGNTFFSLKKYATAEKKYKKALRYYEWVEKNSTQLYSSRNNAKFIELRIVIILNLAAVKIQQSEYKECLTLCNQVLKVDGRNSKALFRRGQAYIGLNEYELGLADFRKAQEESPNSRDIIKKIECIKATMKSHLVAETATCRRMFKDV